MHVRHSLTAAAALALSACSPQATETPETAAAPAAIATPQRMCFLEALNKDSTTVSLTLTGNAVTGELRWNPYQKDGATGTLAGTRTATGELEVLYRYVIEGSAQTETKIMKLAGGKLLVKRGELLDPNNDGNLVFKDAAQATYGQTLLPVPCR